MPAWDTVAIVGVGLIGGSIGLALRERGLARRIVGIGRTPARLETALKLGAVDATATAMAALNDAQLVILATPIEQIVPLAREAATHLPAGALITDAGSTKERIVAELVPPGEPNLGKEVHFVGSHPLAGSDKSGPEHARADLFAGRTVVVTPAANNREQDVDTIEGFWQSLGAGVARMTPVEHDAALAATSHLPHLIASVLAASTPERLLPLAATGFADTTRIAAGDAELWRQIFLANRAHTLRALDNFEKVLAAFRGALAAGDQRTIIALLEQGKAIRDSLGS